MANEPEDRPPSLQETPGTEIETRSTQMQEAVMFKMLDILQKIQENQQKAEKDRGERENKILGQILTTQNTMLEMMKASNKTVRTRERQREGSLETSSEEDMDKSTAVSPVSQNSSTLATRHRISAGTVQVGETNTMNVNKTLEQNINIFLYSDQSNRTDLERSVIKASCDENNEVGREQLEQMKEFFNSKFHAEFKEVREGSIALVFLTANRNHFRKMFFQHLQEIKPLVEEWIFELLRRTKDSDDIYSIDIKLEDDSQKRWKDNSRTGASSVNKDNLQIDDKHNDDDDDDDDNDDDNYGAASANRSGMSGENRHKSGIHPEGLGKNNKSNRSVDAFQRRDNREKNDEGSSSDSDISDDDGVDLKKKGVLKNKNTHPLKMRSKERPLGTIMWHSHVDKSKRQDKIRDDVDGSSDNNKQGVLHGEKRRMPSPCPDASQQDRKGTSKHASNEYQQNYDNNLDDNKDDEDSPKKSSRQQFGPVDTGVDIYRRDQDMSKELFLHGYRNPRRSTVNESNKSDDQTIRSSGNYSKGKDGRGVQRGKCAACTECSKFRGDVRCDYCNCAATQHFNLTHESSDIGASTSLSGTLQPAKGKDGRGVQRGKCAACTECSEFRGDVRCDYCNCAATQHFNLTHESSDIGTSTSLSGTLQAAKGKDGRGVYRGKCAACTECSGFRGDARCDYCNCAATQHFNLTHPSSDIGIPPSLSGTLHPAKGKDGRGVYRGKCAACTECSGFRGDARCDYCNCAATQHLNLTHPSSDMDKSTSLSGTLHPEVTLDVTIATVRQQNRLTSPLPSETTGFSTFSRGPLENATQHFNLTHLSSDIGTSTSLSGNLQPAKEKGRDGRGVRRGKCAGCTECAEFRGDARCDYCNCAATQHFNLTHPSPNIGTSTSLSGTLQPGLDSCGVRRGNCTNCNKCSAFRGTVTCDYCSCEATQHISLTDISSLNTEFKNKFADFYLGNKDDSLSLYRIDLLPEVQGNELSRYRTDQLHEVQDDEFTKGGPRSWTQNYILRISIKDQFEKLDGASQTELQQRFNSMIKNKIRQVRKEVLEVFGAELTDITFENGSIIIKMVKHQLARDAEIMLMGRKENIENYAKSLVRDINTVQLMNSNWLRYQTLHIYIEMEGIFTSTILLEF